MSGESQERVLEDVPHSAERQLEQPPPPASDVQPEAPRPEPTLEECAPELLSLAALWFSLATLTLLGLWLAFRPEAEALAFITKNELPTGTRRRLLAFLGIAAALPAALAGNVLYRAGLSRLPAVKSTVLRLAPLSVLGFLPLLVHFRAFLERELLFLILTSLAVVLFQKLTLSARSEPPPLRSRCAPARCSPRCASAGPRRPSDGGARSRSPWS